MYCLAMLPIIHHNETNCIFWYLTAKKALFFYWNTAVHGGALVKPPIISVNSSIHALQ